MGDAQGQLAWPLSNSPTALCGKRGQLRRPVPQRGWGHRSGGSEGGAARAGREEGAGSAVSNSDAVAPTRWTPLGAARRMTARLLLTTALLLLLQTPAAEALMEPELCYILDAILFLYGIVLTVLYCRLKFTVHRESQQGPGKEKEEAIYTGLTGEGQEMYETLQVKHS
ncbi:high affinity immunoglobulin epsilon receptor subunit gamma isoform X2 [Phalacrocorax carbo]|uniref:high affinity immunoglobulin epsilon receptor subunit gamma isoform X2 n=2 Tax=Phalacrocorax TaxID=9207 RepID=UPI003119CDF4